MVSLILITLYNVMTMKIISLSLYMPLYMLSQWPPPRRAGDVPPPPDVEDDYDGTEGPAAEASMTTADDAE